MRTIFDAEYRPQKRTFLAIVLSWFVTTTIVFLIFERLDQFYHFSNGWTRWIMTLFVTGVVPFLIWYIKMTEQPRK